MIAPEPSIEPGLGHRVEVVGDVEVVPGQHRRARAAGEPELDLAAARRAAGQAVDDLPRRDPELDLVVARALTSPEIETSLVPVEVSVPSLAYSSPPIRMMCGTVAQRLDVVDQRRSVVQALDRRERRLQPRVAALALQRVEQPGLLAADVGAGAAVQDQRDREVRSRGCARRCSRPRPPRRSPPRGCRPGARTRRGCR